MDPAPLMFIGESFVDEGANAAHDLVRQQGGHPRAGPAAHSPFSPFFQSP